MRGKRTLLLLIATTTLWSAYAQIQPSQHPIRMEVADTLPLYLTHLIYQDSANYAQLSSTTRQGITEADTLQKGERVVVYDYIERSTLSESSNSQGEHLVTLETEDQFEYHCAMMRKEGYSPYIDTVRLALDSSTTLCCSLLEGEKFKNKQEYDRCWYTPKNIAYYRNRAGEIISISSVKECGGITAEGDEFYIEGENIERIEAKSRAYFTFFISIYPYGDWSEWGKVVGEYQSEWIDTKLDDRRFRIPVMRELSFDTTLMASIAESRRITHTKIASKYENSHDYLQHFQPAYRANVQKRVEEFVFNMRSEKIDCTTLKGQGIKVLLECFTTHLRIHYKDQSSRSYTLHSTWDVNIP